jgi:2,4-dienoyl-CoA reductase-like NADH-dependent reductase (Old Yellow Enzyme family)
VGSSGAESCEEDLSEFVEFARLMEREGMHYVSVHVSNAAYFAEKWVQMPTDRNPEDVFVHFRLTRMIKEAVGLPVMGAGYSYLGSGNNRLPGDGPEQKSFVYWAEKNLREHSTDMVGVGRQSFADPLFARKVLGGRLDEITYCRACQGCFRLVSFQEKSGCVVYDDRYKKSYRSLLKRKGVRP